MIQAWINLAEPILPSSRSRRRVRWDQFCLGVKEK
jgi:hypothetical protein